MSSQPKPHILFRQEAIETTVKRLAAEVKKDYQGKHPLPTILYFFIEFLKSHISSPAYSQGAVKNQPQRTSLMSIT